MKSAHKLALSLAAVCALMSSSAVNAQGAYPNKPVRLVVPFPPGGGTSYVAQLVGEGLGKAWGQNVLVDNRPGGNTLIGTQFVHKAAPDGYTLLFMTSAHVINEFVTKDFPFDPVREFSPITTLTVLSYGMVVHPSVPARNLKEFLALARAKPGGLNGGTVGEGGPTHLAVQLLNMTADIKTQPVPYKGTGPLMPDMLSGRIDFTFNNLKTLVPMIKAGKLRALGVAATKRSQLLPELPTLSEGGLPGFTAGNWYGIIGPKNVPQPIVLKVAGDLRKVMDTPRILETLDSEGMELYLSANPEEFQALLQSESEKYGKLIRMTADK